MSDRIDVCIFAMDGIKRYSDEVLAKVVASYCISLSTQPLVLYQPLDPTPRAVSASRPNPSYFNFHAALNCWLKIVLAAIF